MVQPAVPGFRPGDQAWLPDGSTGTITAARFDDDGGFWEYILDSRPAAFIAEFELLYTDPRMRRGPAFPENDVQIPPPEEAVEQVGFVTMEDLGGLVLGIMRDRITGLTSREELEALEARVLAQSAQQTSAALVAFANTTVLPLVDQVQDLERQLDELEGLEARVLARSAQQTSAALVAFANTTVLPLVDQVQDLERQLQNLESTVITTLSEIQEWQSGLDSVLEGEGFTSTKEWLKRVTDVLRDPIQWFKDNIEEHVVEELIDGFTR